jgi:hypothetical protein
MVLVVIWLSWQVLQPAYAARRQTLGRSVLAAAPGQPGSRRPDPVA